MSCRREFLSAVAASAVAVAGSSCKRRAREVTVYTSVDQVFSAPIFREFEARSGLAVRAVFDTEETKSTGVVNRLIAEKSRPQADVFWSGDPVRPLLLAKHGLVARYVSPNAATIPAAFRSADGLWTGTAARARVLLVHSAKVASSGRPTSIRDLADARWRGQTAIANPLFGTTTMHVAALHATWGREKTEAFLNALKANGVRVASSNGEVKRLVAAGEIAFGLTDTDDAYEAIADKAPVEMIVPDQDELGALVMPTSVVVIEGGPHPEDARRLVDHLVSAEVEKKMAESGAYMPLRSDVVVPAGAKRASEVRAMSVDYAKMAEAMEAQQPFLQGWAGLGGR